MSRFRTPLVVVGAAPPQPAVAPAATTTQKRKRPSATAQQSMLAFVSPRPPVANATPRAGTQLGATYVIARASLTDREWADVKCDLTLESKEWGDKMQRVTAYSETPTHVRVPRFYGVQKFGPPETVTLSAGAPMTGDWACTLVPKENRRQPEAIAKVKAAFQTRNQWGGFLALPCGWGKTGCSLKIAVDVVRELEGHPRRTLVVVPDSELLNQWVSRVQKFVPQAKVGILRQKKAQIEGYDIVIAMVHSLAAHDDYVGLDTFGCLILDEAHHMSAPMFSQALRRVPAKYILALSATPRRNTDAETQWLHWYMGPTLFQPQRPPDENLLVRMLWYNQTTGKDVSTKGKVPRPLTHVMLQRMVNDVTRTRILSDVIVAYYRDPRRNILVISKRLEQLDQLSEWLLKGQVPATDIGLLTGSVSEKDRAVHKTRRIVLSIEKLGKEGLDATHLNTLVVALPISGIEQPTGRIQRTAEDDEEATEVYVPPVVVYLVDPYSIYEGMAWKNFRQFKSFGYRVVREDLDAYQCQHV